SASQKATTSAVAAASPAAHAAPYPRRSARTTRAPCSRATSGDPSVDPLSTTTARIPSGRRGSSQASPSASSRQGSTTSTTELSSMSSPMSSSSSTSTSSTVGRGPLRPQRQGPDGYLTSAVVVHRAPPPPGAGRSGAGYGVA